MPKKAVIKAAYKYPELSLEHLQRLTDDTGLFQHAKYIIPDRQNGYCTDDNARALVVIVKYYKSHLQPKILRLFEIYLSFLYHSVKHDKTVYNFLEYDRRWRINEPSADALGRVIWAFGSVIADCPNDSYIHIVKEFFNNATNHINSIPPRSQCYAILGLSEFLKKFPQDQRAIELMTNTADTLVKHYNDIASDNWQWFENILSYANAIIPAALYLSATFLKNKIYLDVAEKTCKFLLDNTFNGKYFSFIGSNGWYPKNKKRAKFEQQPIEAADTVIMLAKAYQATKNKKYLTLQQKAFNWFLGENDINKPLYDTNTKGCCDGLSKDGININQGAESIISLLLAQLFLLEST